MRIRDGVTTLDGRAVEAGVVEIRAVSVTALSGTIVIVIVVGDDAGKCIWLRCGCVTVHWLFGFTVVSQRFLSRNAAALG